MLKKFFTVLLFITAVSLSGCAQIVPNSHEEAIISSNEWFEFNQTQDQIIYYTPRLTEYRNDNSVSTFLYGVNKKNHKKSLPSKVEVNCDGKYYRSYRLDAKGTWQLAKDWTHDPNSAAVTYLCLRINNVNEDVRFVYAGKDSNDPSIYWVHAWEPHSNYANDVNKGKVFKLHAKKGSLPWGSGYFVAKCDDSKFNVISDSQQKVTNWRDVKAGSPASFFFEQACGVQSSSAKADAASQGSRASSKNNSSTQKPNAQTAQRPQQIETSPTYQNAQLVVETNPSGATVKDAQTGSILGTTPLVKNYPLDVSKLKRGRCTTINGLNIEWVSGANVKTSNPLKVCMNSYDQFMVTIKRPKYPGLEFDINYPTKQRELKLQEEKLAIQKRQADALEQQAIAQRAQAEAEESQAKSAQDALLLQMFQGGSMIKKAPSRMPINCSRDFFGNYSCF